MIYTIRLNADFQENFFPRTIGYLQNEIAASAVPRKQVLQSILAEVYWKYYQNNQYRFQNRISLGNVIPDSIETWDLSAIMHAVITTYSSSLEKENTLKSIPLKDYTPILETSPFDKKNPAPALDLRPTLFDFLAHRALDFFTNSEGQKIQPVTAFQIDDPAFFDQAEKFSMMQVTSADSLSVRLISLRLFQALAAFHLQDKNPAALIDLELERFYYLKNNAIVAGRDSLYRIALEKLEARYSSSPSSTAVLCALASFLNDQGQRYNPLVSAKNRFEIKQAYELCRKAVKSFPASKGARNCRNLMAVIEQPSVELTKEYAAPVEKPSLLLVRFKNIQTLFFRLFKADPEAFNESMNQLKRDGYLKYFNSLSHENSWSMTLPATDDFQPHSTETRVPGVPAGFFVLVCSTDSLFKDSSKLFTHVAFWSTGIGYASLRTEDGGFDYYLLDRETGLPISGASVEAWTRDYNYARRDYELRQLGNYSSGQNGFFSLPPAETGSRYSNIFLKIRTKNDFFISENFYQYPVSKPNILPQPVTWFFTDRAIYRPGQMIWFKGIMMIKNGDSYKILPNSPAKVIFTDANGQKITEQNLTTNDYGSFNGSFVIPLGLLPGQMTVSNGSGSVQVMVEEYKRPTFEVLFNPLEGNYRLGETIGATGKATGYAGNGLEGATVRYRVVRTARFPFWGRPWYCPLPQSPETEIASGITKTNTDGKFIISFPAVPDFSVDKTDDPVFDYRISVEVTDINGETQSAGQDVSVGYVSLFVNLDLPEKLNILLDTVVKLTTTNLGGRPTPALVSVSWQRLRQPERIFKSRMWNRPDINLSGKEEFYSWFPNDVYNNDDDPAGWERERPLFNKIFDTKNDSVLHLPSLSSGQLRPGYYLVTAKSVDPFGQPVKREFYFIVFDPSSGSLPVNTLNWFVPMKISGNPGETVKFLIGSEEQDVRVLFEIRVHDSVFSREWIDLNQGQRIVEVPVKDSYRGNFFVNFLFARHNRIFQNSQLVSVPWSDKKLDVSFESFRDMLEPGKEEEWKIRITTPGKRGAEAEMLISMYDASLDAFRPNPWSFTLYRQYFSSLPWDINDAFKTGHGSWSVPVKTGDVVPAIQYPSLNWFGLNYFGGYGIRQGRMNKSMALTSEAIIPSAARDEQIPPPADEQQQEPPPPDAGPSGSVADQFSGIQVRRDFRETAFFYPSLLTDSLGRLVVKFTIPESLTRWKLQALAYTKNLDYGLITKDMVTRKELMVFPNAPRFLRQGDTLIFGTKIANLSGRPLSGMIRIELFDGLTQLPLDSLVSGSRSLPFDIPSNGNSQVSWIIRIPVNPGLSVLKYRVVAVAGSCSDGEEKAIPVFPNRMMVTESMPLPVRGKGIFDFTFDKLLQSAVPGKSSSTAKNYRLTLEFASNPAWYAVQALPALGDRKYDNSDAVFASYYANEMASFLMRSNPSIQAVFESWRNLTPEALQSNLEKNQQLKSALLQETPWVAEAKSESENKQRLGQYFDPSALQNALVRDLGKLREIQSPQGGWPWFEGMTSSRYLSQNILTGFGRLYHFGVRDFRKDKDLWNMIIKTIDYLDTEFAGDYDKMKKIPGFKLDDNHLGSLQIQYLYARSFFITEKPMPERTREAYDYYTSQGKRYWLQSDGYLQGMIAITLKRLGATDVAQLIIKSLAEKAVQSKEMGMYWTRPAGWYWYQAPVESQAMMIEAFDEVAGDQKSVDEMKVWLLKQKQTQLWETSRATLDAVYALLVHGADLLAENTGLTINIGKEKIDPSKLIDTKKEAGSGYFQLSWYGKEIEPEMGKITVNNPSGGVAWGAVYWQYFEGLDKITPARTPMTVEKKLFIVLNTPSGPVQTPVAESHPLTIGDRLNVRIVLKVDRDMEFVHLKDLRAAAFEPVNQQETTGYGESGGLSGYRYQEGLGYYQSTTDQAVNFFFDILPKGTYVFEYPLVVNASGEFSNGLATVQCMYAPEFSAHSEGIRVQVK